MRAGPTNHIAGSEVQCQRFAVSSNGFNDGLDTIPYEACSGEEGPRISVNIRD